MGAGMLGNPPQVVRVWFWSLSDRGSYLWLLEAYDQLPRRFNRLQPDCLTLKQLERKTPWGQVFQVYKSDDFFLNTCSKVSLFPLPAPFSIWSVAFLTSAAKQRHFWGTVLNLFLFDILISNAIANKAFLRLQHDWSLKLRFFLVPILLKATDWNISKQGKTHHHPNLKASHPHRCQVTMSMFPK